ncbi:RNA-binding protein [Starmerella bacillaris]|uniref:Ribonuclease P/MRP protein subunit POP5 n=1 Tax=Starmerella bacillaris TaxID=1247836 RepID=A0AAV5RHR8_STABA|nr:RNA-binding protein [Starmerella bacillaris]
MVRLKARYLLFEILYPNRAELLGNADGKLFIKTLRQNIETYFGEYGMGQCQSMLVMKFFNPDTGLGIIRVGRGQEKIVQAAMTLMTHMNTDPVIIRIRRVSGTVKKSQEHALAISKQELFAI